MRYMGLTLAALALVSLAAESASADILVNGGFETGDFSGWSVNDQSLGTFVSSAFPGYAPHSGDYFAALGSSGQLGTISQVLTTTAGTTYTLDFFLASDGNTLNEFRVSWNGSTLFDQTNIGAQDYVEYTLQVTATGVSTNLTFFEQNDLGFLSLDDVSVNAVTVPESSSLLMLCLGAISMATSAWYSRMRTRYRWLMECINLMLEAFRKELSQ